MHPKDRIIEALEFPRGFIRNGLLPEQCSFGLQFYARSDECQNCVHAQSCRFVCNVDDPVGALASKPLPKLLEALRFGIDYVIFRVLDREHDETRCTCAACTWLRASQAILADYDEVEAAATKPE